MFLVISQLPGTIASLNAVVGKSFLRIAVFFTSGAMVAHFMACIFYWVATIGSDSLDPYPGWTSMLEEEDMSTVEKYVASLYWSFSTITTVGYGDLTPSNTAERLFAIVAMVVGVTIFAYFMGSMTSIVSALNESQQQYDKRMEEVETFLTFRDIPASLAERVKSYYRFLWARELQAEEGRWLDGLNGALRTEMVLYMYQDAVARVPFFHGKHPHFIAALVLKLKPETYSPHDVVSREGEPATCMYFVSRGCLDVCLKISDELAQDILRGKAIPKVSTPSSFAPSQNA
jgi:voltage-gated potassium channel